MAQITIITAMYNVSSYLDAYVRSIFEQSFKDFKVLCINDGSTDDTLQHIRELTKNDARFTILTHENRGVYYNYKLALERVDTPYFSILDPDDWYAPNHLELLYQAIQKDDADLAKGSLVRNYPSQSSNHTSTASHDASIERLDHRNDTIRKDIQRGHHPARHNCGSQWISHLYKTDFVKKNAISFYTRDDGFEWDGDDIFLLSILLKQPKIVFCDDAHYHYLQRATSAVHQINPLRFTSTVKSRQIETQILNAAYQNGSLSLKRITWRFFRDSSSNSPSISGFTKRQKVLIPMLTSKHYPKSSNQPIYAQVFHSSKTPKRIITKRSSANYPVHFCTRWIESRRLLWAISHLHRVSP